MTGRFMSYTVAASFAYVLLSLLFSLLSVRSCHLSLDTLHLLFSRSSGFRGTITSPTSTKAAGWFVVGDVFVQEGYRSEIRYVRWNVSSDKPRRREGEKREKRTCTYARR